MEVLAKWPVDSYHCMITMRVLAGLRVELLAGDIIEMSSETPLHYTVARRGSKYIEELLAGRAEVRLNGPITLPESESAPDVAVVRSPESTYLTRHPNADDIFWLIEIATANFKLDVDTKSAIYAAADIQEYWILDLSDRKLVVLRSPIHGTYTKQLILSEGNIYPLPFPDTPVVVRQLFP